MLNNGKKEKLWNKLDLVLLLFIDSKFYIYRKNKYEYL